MNGYAEQQPSQSSSAVASHLTDYVHALEAIYDPKTENERRQQASVFLHEQKSNAQAPFHGCELYQTTSQGPVVRYYGLSLIEHFLKYRWQEFGDRQIEELRTCVIDFAKNARDEDPLFLRNKLAQLWVELALRFWLTTWPNMDEDLRELWSRSLIHKDMVCIIIETLVDEAFTREDVGDAKSGNPLGSACVELMTPSSILSQAFPSRELNHQVRATEAGWIQPLSDFLSWCQEAGIDGEKSVASHAVRALAAIRASASWILPNALSETSCLHHVLQSLTVQSESVRLAAVEVLLVFYRRSHFKDQELIDLVCPLLQQNALRVLQETYRRNIIHLSQDDCYIDDEKHNFLKKFAEVICSIGIVMEVHSELFAERCDLAEAFNLFYAVFENPSFMVSIPIVYLFSKLLGSDSPQISSEISRYLLPLFEKCSERLLNYELLPSDDFVDASSTFLLHDYETVPERHAFMGNYRRYCKDVIDGVVSQEPPNAMRHVMTQANQVLDSVYNEDQELTESNFRSNLPAALKVDTQATVFITAMKGFLRGYAQFQAHSEGKDLSDYEQAKDALYDWTENLIKVELKNPIIQKRMLQLIVEIATVGLLSRPKIAVSICEKVLSKTPETCSGTLYGEAMREMQAARPRELQRLAIVFADTLMNVHNALDSGVNYIVSFGRLDERTTLEYRSFLYILILRTSVLDEQEKFDRLNEFLRPVIDLWRDSELEQHISTFESFCAMLGLDRVPAYFLSHKASEIQDWSTRPLDKDGVELRENILALCEKLPLQPARALLSASIERISPRSKEYALIQQLWAKHVPAFLPKILTLLGHAHAFNNPSTWSSFPSEMQTIIQRILVDRVWQNGISMESKDEFFNRVKESKSSLEGLASSIRSAVRTVRELSYWILHCSTHLGEAFYGHTDLPEPLAQAMNADAVHLSPHQLTSLLKLSAAIVEGCPSSQRSHFLPPLLTSLFSQLDAKISAEWDGIEQRRQADFNEENLEREMKNESVLRTLTHSAVLQLQSHINASQNGNPANNEPSLRQLILNTPTILEPMILFCTHTLRMHDQRSCVIIINVLQGIIHEFAATQESQHAYINPSTAAQVREFFSTEVLKACITSIHEPYFFDIQKEFAYYIARLLMFYCSSTPTPREVLLSLPGMTVERVDSHLQRLIGPRAEKGHRAQRSVVLSLLENVRGVSLHEQGKIAIAPISETRKKRTVPQAQYMDGVEGALPRDPSPDLGGVAELLR